MYLVLRGAYTKKYALLPSNSSSQIHLPICRFCVNTVNAYCFLCIRLMFCFYIIYHLLLLLIGSFLQILNGLRRICTRNFCYSSNSGFRYLLLLSAFGDSLPFAYGRFSVCRFHSLFQSWQCILLLHSLISSSFVSQRDIICTSLNPWPIILIMIFLRSCNVPFSIFS